MPFLSLLFFSLFAFITQAQVPTNLTFKNKSVRGGVGPAQSGQYLARWSWASPLRHSDLEEAFWELTGFGFVGTPKLSELEAGAIPGWVTTLGSCFVSSQKQNRAGWNKSVRGGVGPAQSGQYLARWSWASPLRHSDLEEAFWELTGFGFVGTPKLSELEAGAIPGWVTTLGSCFVSSQKQNRAGCSPGWGSNQFCELGLRERKQRWSWSTAWSWSPTGWLCTIRATNSPKPLLYFTLAQRITLPKGSLEHVTIHSGPDEGSGYDLTLNYQAANHSSIGTIYLAKTKYNSTSTFLRLGIDGNVKLYTYNDQIDFGAWEVSFSFFDRDNSIWWENECQLPERCGKFGLCEGSQCVACPSAKGLLGWSKTCEPEKLTSCRASSFRYYKLKGIIT
ncbi:hypothetical protein L3X38_023158 [Prunus dulcis]|uniref:Uncharacterized protein n=1 Tax=Prunus dulcis TaxID=3755 RepID=A0AAD4VYG3_PRUDU|nr:hypothetical protein L3X38_023158 [Prunus dulcis]